MEGVLRLLRRAIPFASARSGGIRDSARRPGWKFEGLSTDGLRFIASMDQIESGTGPVLFSTCLAFAKEPFDVKSGSCGTVVRNAELKIVDPETGLSLPRNQPGEICIGGKQIMKEASERRTIDKEGWLHTGDSGYVDDDEEIFIAHPNIADAAVVSMKDDLCGELPVAFVARSSGSEITEDEIKRYISKQNKFGGNNKRYEYLGRDWLISRDNCPLALEVGGDKERK